MTTDHPGTRQRQAADPGASVWLSANAGSGKTKVLIDRVARLLVEGVAPQRILCLTYTKAAAGEMQNRLFARLGGWAMLDDGGLGEALAALGVVGPLAPARLAAARRLFAQAIETPGGLRIQTLHAFCASLLRRFPLEAGVSPAFTELDDRAARLLRADVLETLARDDPAALDALARLAGGAEVGERLDDIAAGRRNFRYRLDEAGAHAAFGLPAGFDEAALCAAAFDGSESPLLAALVPLLDAGTPTDVRAAGRLAALLPWTAGAAVLEALEGVLLYGSAAKAAFGAKTGAFPTRQTRSALGPLLQPLEALMARVEAARPLRLALEAAVRTAALHRFAGPFLDAYAAAKARRGWLDFDDLILAAADLLADPGRAAWVLWRLDGGIDHILIDEAQDTSPAQWSLVESLTQEMTAGEGARAGGRTLFVVGDRKQSIYSFQGADLAAFDGTHLRFRDRLAGSPRPLLDLTLEYSFRSSPAILGVVDLTFDERRGAGLGGEVKHRPFLHGLPGRVDLWPVVPKPERAEDPAWDDPVDRVEPDHPEKLLARMLAAEIGRMLGTPVATREGPRPLRAGDVMVLVRRRSVLFAEMIRACKELGLPVAGADRLRVGAELAVRDLAAMLSFLALPEDDLALACLLRSPLLGWDEGALLALAQPRPPDASLWQALRSAGAAHPDSMRFLDDLRAHAEFERPFDLVERALVRHDGRVRLIARLGAEAEDGIDAFLAQALAYERTEVPSLTGFLRWMETGDLEIKRQLDAAGDLIRVMTVHGAKGLEAPVVILPDTAVRRPPRAPAIVSTDAGALAGMAREDSPPALAAAAAVAAARAAAEEDRLLYVAMTRAQSWLIVAGAGDTGRDCWYSRIAAGIEAAGATALSTPAGQGLRHAQLPWPADAPAAPPAAGAAPGLPGWLRLPPAPPAAGVVLLSPSGLGGAKALPGEVAGLEAEAALRRGRALHLLLEHLPGWPEEGRARRAADLVAAADDPPPQTDLPGLVDEAARLLADPALGFLFAPGALAEVPLTAALPELGGRRILGQIDRLLVLPGRVLAVDYKSNAIVPDRPDAVPEGLLRQMGAYATALAQIYPGRRIETALLWTALPRLMPLPSALVMAALHRAAA
ncbi:MAG: double-strand break repair helicase AddA [Rhodobacteraceae bacterium]|nr:double-strand break repair helicase AddA [Paracoccaceae bacterium]